MINAAQLARIFPASSANRRNAFINGIQTAITLTNAGETVNRTAGLLATIAIETGELKWLEEIWGPTTSQRSYVGRMGNRTLSEAQRYKGRGFVMLTGIDAYQAAKLALGIDLVNHPQQASTPDIAGRILAWYWNAHDINEHCDLGHWQDVRRAVNGGLNGFDVFMATVKRAQSVLGG
jgi:putative chitinase